MIRLEDYRRVAPPGVVDIVLKLADRIRGRRFLHLSGGRFGSTLTWWWSTTSSRPR